MGYIELNVGTVTSTKTVNDSNANRLITSMLKLHYDEEAVDEATPQQKADYAVQLISNYVVDSGKAYEANKAAEDARQETIDEIDELEPIPAQLPS